jgi:hypothetical protein
MDNNFIFNTRGLINNRNSCFMDTVIMSMFCYKSSPFYNFTDPKYFDDFKVTIKDEINNDKLELNDLKIRKEIQRILCLTIEKVTSNSSVECSNLRAIIEMFFKWKNSMTYNLMYGQQDVIEFYDRFVKVFNFNPIAITTVRQSKTDKNVKIIKGSSTIENMAYISIPNDGTDFDGLDSILEPDWEDLGEDKKNWKHNKKDIPTYRWTRNRIKSIEGDNCLVFHINRTSIKFQNGQAVTYKTKNKIKMPTCIKLKNKKYTLFSSILHLSSSDTINHGHYISIFYNGKEYFAYDDMNNGNISHYKIPKEKAEPIRDTNGVLFFYYLI